MLGIGEAARRLHVAPHVLHHWEELGVISPGRTPAGHRRYSEDDLRRARLILRLQRAGLSLAQIHAVVNGDTDAAEQILLARAALLHGVIEDATVRAAWLDHAATCRTPRCPHCASLERAVCAEGDERCDDTLGLEPEPARAGETRRSD